MPSELFSTRLLVLPSLALCLALGTGCEEEDPFAHLRETTSESDGDDADDNDDDTGGGSKDDDSDGRDDDDNDSTGKEGKDSDGDTDEDTGDKDDTDTEDSTDQEPPENKMCDLRPSSLAVLGDATPAGKTVGGDKSDTNAFKLLHAHLKSEHILSELSYENYAKDNAKFVELDASQMLQVSQDVDGPVMVVIHSGSHDLAGYILKSDSKAQDDFDGEWGKSLASLEKLVAHFEDTDKFPKGATIVLNTLYNPFDDCQEAHNAVTISKIKTGLMGQFNQNLRDFADEHDHVFIADQHPAFLGHGHHYKNSKCPHYKDGSKYLMQGGLFDLTNLSEAGHAFMGDILKETVDQMFKGCS